MKTYGTPVFIMTSQHDLFNNCQKMVIYACKIGNNGAKCGVPVDYHSPFLQERPYLDTIQLNPRNSLFAVLLADHTNDNSNGIQGSLSIRYSTPCGSISTGSLATI